MPDFLLNMIAIMILFPIAIIAAGIVFTIVLVVINSIVALFKGDDRGNF